MMEQWPNYPRMTGLGTSATSSTFWSAASSSPAMSPSSLPGRSTSAIRSTDSASALNFRSENPEHANSERMRAVNLGIETRLSDQIARYLDLATSEAKLTAANMANIDTPGYRAVGMDFEQEMRGALTGL